MPTVTIALAGGNVVPINFGDSTIEAARQAAIAQSAATDVQNVADSFTDNLRQSSNLYDHSTAGDVTLGEPQLDRLYNTNGTIATLAKWFATGTSGPYPAGDYTVEILPHINSKWKLRNRAHFFDTEIPSAATLDSITGLADAQVQSYNYTAPANVYHAFNGQWTDAGSSPTAADFAELLAGIIIREAGQDGNAEQTGRFIAPARFGQSDNLDGDVIAQWVGSYIYCRIPGGWDDDTDRLQRWLVGHEGGFTTIGDPEQGNGVIDMVGEKLVISSWPRQTDLAALWDASNSIQIRTGGDECAPIRLGGNLMYIGAGHGWVCRLATVTGEAVTYGHIGNLYTDTNGLEYVVAWADPAGGRLKLIPKPTGSAGLWTHTNGVIAGGTLTPVGGGTTLTVTTEASSQLFPMVKNYEYSVAFDDGRGVARGMPMRSGSALLFSEKYTIPNFIQLYNDIAALPTQTANPDYGPIGTVAQVEDSVTYRVDYHGIPTRSRSVYFHQASVVSVHTAQMVVPSLTNGATSIIAFLPGSGVVNGLNFVTGANVTSNAVQHDFTQATWANSTEPPDSLVLLARLSATTKHGVVTAISNTIADGITATRDALVGTGIASFLSTSEKGYMLGATAYSVAAGATIDGLGVSGAVNPNDFGDADFAYSWEENGKTRVRAYRATALNNARLPLPRRLANRAITLSNATNGGTRTSKIVSGASCRVNFGTASQIDLEIG